MGELSVFCRMEELRADQFDNLDAWVPKTLAPLFEKEILSKLLLKKKKEGEEQKKDPLLISSGPRSGPGAIHPPARPHIIGDPYI